MLGFSTKNESFNHETWGCQQFLHGDMGMGFLFHGDHLSLTSPWFFDPRLRAFPARCAFTGRSGQVSNWGYQLLTITVVNPYHAYCIILIYDTVKHSGKKDNVFRYGEKHATEKTPSLG